MRQRERRNKQRRQQLKEVFIFAGTTEGRTLAEELILEGVPCTVSVATEYGTYDMAEAEGLRLLAGRLTKEEMREKFASGDYACVVDATHPFATVVTKEIKEAAAEEGLPCLRLSRATKHTESDRGVYVDSLNEALDYLKKSSGNILLTTGSKDLSKIAKGIGDNERLYARVLPSSESIGLCEDAGLKGRHVIAMQGPFSEKMNIALIEALNAKYILTKETGNTGGFEEKLSAAKKTGAIPVIIRNPELAQKRGAEAQKEGTADTVSYFKGNALEVKEKLSDILGISMNIEETCSLSLVGLGPGRPNLMTKAAEAAIANADVVFGAERLIKSVEKLLHGKPSFPWYQSDKILDYLKEHLEYSKPVVLFSGDTGFFSGAVTMLRDLRKRGEEEDYDVELFCGISSVVYFCSKIGVAWHDARLISRHGRGCNVIGNVRNHKKCLLLVSDVEELNALGETFCKAEQEGILPKLHIFYGYQLSYPEEVVDETDAEGLRQIGAKGLYVLMIVNDGAGETVITPGLPDGAFIRDKAPMTKEEVRVLSLSKLQLTRDAVLYDIGAGTGSISVEAALLCTDGQVYALEYKEDALEVTRRNKEHFCLENMEVISGKAPEGLEELPKPSHAFIGGSAGNMREILEVLLEKNPEIRIVVNCIALETLSELLNILKELPVTEPEYVQLTASRGEKVGKYHLLKSQNSIFIVSFNGMKPSGIATDRLSDGDKS